MRTVSRKYNFWLASSFAALALAGCQSADRRPYQGDPLLAYKKPVTQVPKADEKSVLLAFAEPKPPDLPQAALLAEPASRRTGTALARDETDRTNNPAAASSSGATRANSRLEVFLTSRCKVPGTYGRASDYSWLQGTLERSKSGAMELDYTGPGKPDAWGGKVRLLNDDRLTDFRPSDVILVEGKLVSDSRQPAGTKPANPPSYRIEQVWLVRLRD